MGAAMSIRRLLWIAIPLLLVLALAGVGGLAWYLLRGTPAPIRLVAIGPNKTVRLLGQEGELVLASDANDADALNFAYPTPAPDGQRLAYVTTDDNGAAIQRLDLKTGERKELYRSKANFPYDLAWSPDGKYIAFLAGNPLTLHIVPTDGSKPAQPVATGQPSYFAWRPDSSALLLHIGGHSVEKGQMLTYQAGAEQSNPLLSDPGFFQAPAWAVDGQHFFYAAQPPIGKPQPEIEDVSSNIVRVNADGKEPMTLVEEKKAYLWMVRAPNSDQIAYVARTIDKPEAGVLKLVDAAGGAARTLSRAEENVTAFFWSPDDKRIAYLTFDNTDLPALTWHIIDVAGGAARDFEAFQPSKAFAELQNYFDAYTFSFSPWSPDSSRIVYGAQDGVYVLDVAAGRAAKATDGTMGMWVGGK
jgi:TolB protein